MPHDVTPGELLYAGVQLTRPLLRNITTRVEADLAGTGISVGQRAILEALRELGQATAPQITGRLDVKRQFVGREIKALLERGFVEAVANPDHRASRFYRLTPTSTRIIDGIRTREKEQFDAFASRFTSEEIAAYCKIQSALNREMSARQGRTEHTAT